MSLVLHGIYGCEKHQGSCHSDCPDCQKQENADRRREVQEMWRQEISGDSGLTP